MAMKKMLKKTDSDALPERKNPIAAAPPYEDEWLAAGLIKEENQFGIVYKKIVTYDANYKQGAVALGKLPAAIEQWRNTTEYHPLKPDFNKPLVFFDTETTGLKGAGTLIFLLGFIEQKGDTFTLTQYVLPRPDHELAFLYASNLWAHKFTLVTYNGKSFDVPQLETRWTINRHRIPPLLTHAHIDLLHGSRRIWRDEMEAFKLTTIEQEKLRFFREGDIPGHMAPIIYQDAVKSGNPAHLMKVLKHNEWDILSLVALYIRATALVLETDLKETATTQTNIGKWFADLKSYEQSERIFERVIDAYGINHPVTHYHFGFIMKRNENYEAAVTSFTIAAEGLVGRQRIIALEELAKLYEHRLKQVEDALQVTKLALKFIHVDDNLTSRFRVRARGNFLRREMRVSRKLFPGQAH